MPDTEQISIVIIDDDRCQRVFLSAILRKNHYRVKAVSNRQDGLRVISEENPDLVITDILMPDFDGLEIIAQLKKQYRDLKIIALSGEYSADLYLELAIEFGADNAFIKPFETKDFLEAVQFLMRGKNASSRDLPEIRIDTNCSWDERQQGAVLNDCLP